MCALFFAGIQDRNVAKRYHDMLKIWDRLKKDVAVDRDYHRQNLEGGKDMKEFVEFIAKHLVDKPEEVQVTEIDGERTVVYELRVGDGDLGKVMASGAKPPRRSAHCWPRHRPKPGSVLFWRFWNSASFPVCLNPKIWF